MKRSMPALVTLTLAAFLAALSGCDHPPDLVTEAGGHAISARIRGPHSVETEADRAVISGSLGTVTIEGARVRLNAGQWVAIPEGVPVVLEMARTKLRLKAGNVTISQSTR